MDQNQSDNDAIDELLQAMIWLNKGIKKGLELLHEDLVSHDSYDPVNKLYDEKNSYFNRANKYGGWLLTSGIHGPADLYYRRMLDKIIDYESLSGKCFNKGMAYANLGIAQIAQGKFDAGIAHLLTAELEDRDVADPKEFILDSPLWRQFENKVFTYLMSFSKKHGINFVVDHLFLENLFKDIDREDRIYLQGTILALLDNIELNNVVPNNFTYGRLYSMLKDLCLLIESLLHKKQTHSGRTLHPILVTVLRTQSIVWPSSNAPPNAIDFKRFVDELETVLSNQSNDKIRWADCVYLIRNYTGHHFKIDENTKSTGGKSFFGDLYLPALESTFALLLYLKHIKAI